MFTVRAYTPDDLTDCARCFYEGFFHCGITDNDRLYLNDYAQVMIEKSNFTYVAVAEGKVVGFICGLYSKVFNPKLFKSYDTPKHYGMWLKFVFKYYLKGYRLSKDFDAAYKVFFAQLQERKKLPLGQCDCELAALSSCRDYRRGVGTALLEAFVKRCRRDNAKSIRLFTNTDASYTFYDRRGFRRVGEKPFSGAAEGASFVYELLL